MLPYLKLKPNMLLLLQLNHPSLKKHTPDEGSAGSIIFLVLYSVITTAYSIYMFLEYKKLSEAKEQDNAANEQLEKIRALVKKTENDNANIDEQLRIAEQTVENIKIAVMKEIPLEN